MTFPRSRHRSSSARARSGRASPAPSTRVLFLLAADGRIVRGRPRGSWTSSQYRWAPMSSWVPPGTKEPSVQAARATLVGVVAAHVRSRDRRRPQVVDRLDGWGSPQCARRTWRSRKSSSTAARGFVLADDAAPVRAGAPFAALLPSLDTTVMGWTERRWFLGPHGGRLFDRSGNPGPTVWWDGTSGRRLDATAERRGRLPTARGRRRRSDRRHRRRGGAPDVLARSCARHASVPHASRARARRREPPRASHDPHRPRGTVTR